MAVRMSGSGTSSVRVGGIQGLRIGSEVTLEAHVGLVGSLEAALAANPVGRSLAQSAITCVVALEYRLARVPRGVSPEAGHARRCGAVSTLWAQPHGTGPRRRLVRTTSLDCYQSFGKPSPRRGPFFGIPKTDTADCKKDLRNTGV